MNETTTMAFNESIVGAQNETLFPARQMTEYAEMAFLSLMLLVGAPLNIVALSRMFGLLSDRSNDSGARSDTVVSQSRSSGSSKRVVSRFGRLKIHLISANLLIICVYGPSQIGWLATIGWYGGDALCRLIKFLHTFCFYATSNIVATIAIDRLCVAIRLDRQQSRVRFLRAATAVAWLLAFVCSLPQAFVWRTYAPFPDEPGWYQCVTIWVVVQHRLANNQSLHGMDGVEGLYYEKLYGATHLLLVFWLPALVIMCSYTIIVARFQLRIRQTIFAQRRREKRCDVGSSTGLKPMLAGAHGWPSTPNASMTTLSKVKRKTIQKTIWILTAYILCWSPYNILELSRYFDLASDNYYLEVLTNLIVLNAVLNPLLYSC